MKIWEVLLIILLIVVALLAVLYFVGRKMQKKQAVQQQQMEAVKQTVTMLVIDKKKMRLKDAGLPAAVLEQTPKMMRRTKLPIVKAKIGPKVMTLICEPGIFDLIPLKKTVKATISGLYITEVKGIRGSLETPPKKEKKGILSRFRKNKEDSAGNGKSVKKADKKK